MTLATCICGEHGSVNVSGEGYGRTFGPGSVVDLDERVRPDVKQTWRQAIGARYAHLFEEVATESTKPRHGRRDGAEKTS
jgi:hypothetical protein